MGRIRAKVEKIEGTGALFKMFEKKKDRSKLYTALIATFLKNKPNGPVLTYYSYPRKDLKVTVFEQGKQEVWYKGARPILEDEQIPGSF